MAFNPKQFPINPSVYSTKSNKAIVFSPTSPKSIKEIIPNFQGILRKSKKK